MSPDDSLLVTNLSSYGYVPTRVIRGQNKTRLSARLNSGINTSNEAPRVSSPTDCKMIECRWVQFCYSGQVGTILKGDMLDRGQPFRKHCASTRARLVKTLLSCLWFGKIRHLAAIPWWLLNTTTCTVKIPFNPIVAPLDLLPSASDAISFRSITPSDAQTWLPKQSLWDFLPQPSASLF
nr:hypothetical protein L204_00536 [Cryptococcus depauperatus CBS 7855]